MGVSYKKISNTEIIDYLNYYMSQWLDLEEK